MCSWAFELLRTEHFCLSTDFRTFHQRYSELWGDEPARCLEGSPLPCAGNDPDGCWRFKGMVIQDQSAHDSECRQQCPKLSWDEFSYRSIAGARAVALRSDESNELDPYIHYCSASERTMAVSHVWSHGQGGRPHEGVNLCLHRRYVKLAKRLDCDSYWWDSACIPEDHQLRSEAIQNINSTFASSKVVLVCDRDIMRVNASDLTMQVKESILATALVCDWNLRAWTFLESLKGRQNIHLLCKDDVAIPFFDIVRDIADYGSIDLAILSFAVPQMFPDVRRIDSWTREQVGQALSYRAASREGDDNIIWSLLFIGETYDSAEKFWLENRFTSSHMIHTGFLMSSAPRLSTKAFSWAPVTPYFKPLPKNSARGMSSFRAFDSHETYPGIITDKGLVAAWHEYEFPSSSFGLLMNLTTGLSKPQMVILEQICSLYLQDSVWGALLRPMSNMSTFEQDRDLSTRYNGLVKGTLVAVLGSKGCPRPSEKPAENRGWKWKGVFEWDVDVPLPAFKAEYDFLIE